MFYACLYNLHIWPSGSTTLPTSSNVEGSNLTWDKTLCDAQIVDQSLGAFRIATYMFTKPQRNIFLLLVRELSLEKQYQPIS